MNWHKTHRRFLVSLPGMLLLGFFSVADAGNGALAIAVPSRSCISGKPGSGCSPQQDCGLAFFLALTWRAAVASTNRESRV